MHQQKYTIVGVRLNSSSHFKLCKTFTKIANDAIIALSIPVEASGARQM